jgi:hypothetical protein
MDPIVLRLLVVVAIVVAAGAAGRWWRSRDGRVRDGDGAAFSRDELDAVGLDVRGTDTVALLLGSPTCAPCVTVRRVLTDVTSDRPGFRWVYADAAEHLALAERHRVRRVPTLFVLDPRGRVLARTSGVPTHADLRRVLDREGDLASAA